MLLGGGDQLVLELLVVAAEAVVVGVGELDGVEVGHDRAALAEHGGAVVHGAADGGGDLDRLDLGLERAREGTVDGTLEALLDAVEQSHCPLLTLDVWPLIVTGSAARTAPRRDVRVGAGRLVW